jgi:putative MFS transporter
VVLAKLVSNGWSNNYLNAAFTSALMFGYFIGSLTGGFIGDYLGRRAFRLNADRRDFGLCGNLCA